MLAGLRCGAAASTHAMVMLLVEMDGLSSSSLVDLQHNHECHGIDVKFMCKCMACNFETK
jgi:hypothetical protein